MTYARLFPLLLVGLLACSKPAVTIDPTTPGQPNPPATGTPTEVGKPTGPVTTKTIGPAGGTLSTPDGKLTLTFPAGAVTKETLVSIQPVENKAIHGIGTGYEFGPDGTRFAKPVTFTYHYTPNELRGASPGAMALASQNPQRVWLLERFVSVDPASRTITGQLDHFSWWSIITLFYMTPQEAVLGPGTGIDLKITQCADLPAIPKPGDAANVPLLASLVNKAMTSSLVKAISLNGQDKLSVLTDPTNPDGTIGFSYQTKEATIRYQAPGLIPQNNPVAVAVTIGLDSKAQFMLVSNLTIENNNSFSVKGKRFTDVLVSVGFIGGKFTLTMLDRVNPMNALYATAKLTGEGSARFDEDGNAAVGSMLEGNNRIEGQSTYRTCVDEFSEGGTVTITKVYQQNGQRMVEGTVVGTVVEKHEVDPRTCAVLKHETFQVSGRFQAPLQ